MIRDVLSEAAREINLDLDDPEYQRIRHGDELLSEIRTLVSNMEELLIKLDPPPPGPS